MWGLRVKRMSSLPVRCEPVTPRPPPAPPLEEPLEPPESGPWVSCWCCSCSELAVIAAADDAELRYVVAIYKRTTLFNVCVCLWVLFFSAICCFKHSYSSKVYDIQNALFATCSSQSTPSTDGTTARERKIMPQQAHTLQLHGGKSHVYKVR